MDVFQSFYVLEDKILGKGSFGTVYLGKDVANDKYVALKEIPKEIMNNKKRIELLYNEILIPSELKNEHLVKIFDKIELNNKKYIDFEFCNGGDLRRYLTFFKVFEEKYIQYFMKQILNGLSALHSKNIIHHDIKPENVLVQLNPYTIKNKKKEKEKYEKIINDIMQLTSSEKDNNSNINIDGDYILQTLQYSHLKLSDFGLSKYKEDNNQKMRSGTELYMDPNIFRPDANTFIIEEPKNEIWSIGIFSYELLFGKRPFNSKRDIEKGIYIIDLKECKKISKQFLSFLNMCLQRKQNSRPNIKELMLSEFITNEYYNFEFIDENNLNEIKFPNKVYICNDDKIIKMNIDDDRSVNIEFDC